MILLLAEVHGRLYKLVPKACCFNLVHGLLFRVYVGFAAIICSWGQQACLGHQTLNLFTAVGTLIGGSFSHHKPPKHISL